MSRWIEPPAGVPCEDAWGEPFGGNFPGESLEIEISEDSSPYAPGMLSSRDAELATWCSSSLSPAETARAGITAMAAECPELVADDIDEMVNGVARELGESPVDAMAARAGVRPGTCLLRLITSEWGCIRHSTLTQPLGLNQQAVCEGSGERRLGTRHSGIT